MDNHVLADVAVVELDEGEASSRFAQRCRELLGVEPEEFLAAYDAGEAWMRWSHHDGVTELILAVPLARYVPVED